VKQARSKHEASRGAPPPCSTRATTSNGSCRFAAAAGSLNRVSFLGPRSTHSPNSGVAPAGDRNALAFASRTARIVSNADCCSRRF
jgi:hypothetical protein